MPTTVNLQKRTAKEWIAMIATTPRFRRMTLLCAVIALAVVSALTLTRANRTMQPPVVKLATYDGCSFTVPRVWQVSEENGELVFRSGGKVVGGLVKVRYYPDGAAGSAGVLLPVPNHSQTLEQRELGGFSRRTYYARVVRTQPAASGDTSEVTQDHVFILLPEKNTAYDFWFDPAVVTDAEMLGTAKSFDESLSKVGATAPEEESLAALIERKLDAIIAMQKSNESEHNKNAFKGNTLLEIAKYGEPALAYMLDQFAKGNGKGERGNLMAEACILILGPRNNVPKGWRSGEEWYSKLKPLEITPLPPASRPSGNTVEALVDAAALEHYKGYHPNGVVLVASHVFDKHEEGDVLTIWATVFYSEYVLYGREKLVQNTGGVVPAAIKYRRLGNGSYALSEYVEARDGALFEPSIREFCRPKPGVADEMLKHYMNYSDLIEKMRRNLVGYLQANGLSGVYLETPGGERIPLT